MGIERGEKSLQEAYNLKPDEVILGYYPLWDTRGPSWIERQLDKISGGFEQRKIINEANEKFLTKGYRLPTGETVQISSIRQTGQRDLKTGEVSAEKVVLIGTIKR